MNYYLGLSLLKPKKGEIGKPIARIYVKTLSERNGEKNLLTPDCVSMRELDEVISNLKKELDAIRAKAKKEFDKK